MASKLEHTEAHDNFVLDKKEIDDVTIGQPNEKLILCNFCESVLIPEGNATKVQLEVDLIQNTMREYDMCSTYWHVEALTKFENIEVHQIEGDIKYLCCLSCQSAILGYQIISNPRLIFIACDRVKEEI
jgi:hypothetical protein